MITSNPYNLPDKILKPNQITKPITLQNKKSRDRSYDYSKQMSTKGIKIESQMKKSLNLQHITSSPNLHTPSTSSSTNRPIDPPSLPRQVEYHQTHIQSIPQTQHDRRIKFLFEKFYQINEQLSNHDSLLNKLVNEKDKDRNSWDSPFELNGNSQKQSREKDDVIRNQARSFHINGQAGVNTPGNQSNLSHRQIEQLKKQVSTLKQQISGIKTLMAKEKEQQNNPMNLSKSIKFNGNVEFESINLQRKFADDFSRIYQTIQQLKMSTQDKIIKIQNNVHKIDGNNQIIGHKINKAQERIENMQSNIQNHMNLVNQQINSALTKIVSSINEKISKALQNNVVLVNEKLKKCIQTCKTVVAQNKKLQPTLKPSSIEGRITINSGMILKLSGYRAQGKTVKLKLKSALTIMDQKNRQKTNYYQQKEDISPKKGEYSGSTQSTSSEEIILGSNIYHIDADGYLMDENKVYLLDENNNLLQLETDKLNKIKQLGLLI